VFTSPWNSQIW